VSIDNDADRRRAFAFWFLLVGANLGFAVSILIFSMVQYGIGTQLAAFLIICAILSTALLLGRWNPQPSEEEDYSERWRIGPWMITFMVLEIGFCGLQICFDLWAILTHYKLPPAAM